MNSCPYNQIIWKQNTKEPLLLFLVLNVLLIALF